MAQLVERSRESNIHALQEKKVREILVGRNDIEKHETNITVKYIKDGVFALFNGKNVYGFVNENADVIRFLRSKSPMFHEGAFLAGYREIRNDEWVDNLYRIQDIDSKTGKELPGAKPIDPFSVEFYNAWSDIDFCLSKLELEILKRGDAQWNFIKIHPGKVDLFLKSKALRIRDIESYLKNKQIDTMVFDLTLNILKNQLIQQIIDPRVELVADPITFPELVDYYEKGYIDHMLYMKAIKALDETEKLKLKRDDKRKAIKGRTKSELESLK